MTVLYLLRFLASTCHGNPTPGGKAVGPNSHKFLQRLHISHPIAYPEYANYSHKVLEKLPLEYANQVRSSTARQHFL